MAFSRDQRFLYALNNRTGAFQVSGFRAGADGSLASIGGAGAPLAGAVGIAAR